jgi:ketosteroid isomerase-like protein
MERVLPLNGGDQEAGRQRALASSRNALATVTVPADTGRAMSEENVEVVRRTASALAAGDWEGVFETWDPQIEWHFEREAVISGLRRGRDQVQAALSSFMTEWEDFTVEIEDLIPADDERVVMLVHLSGRGRGSGIPLDSEKRTSSPSVGAES